MSFNKNCYVLILLILLSSLCLAAPEDHFVTTWKTDNQGFSNNSSITIGTNGGGYSYSVDWDNDNIVDETGLTGDASHDYGTPGTYTVRIFGDFPQLFMGPTLDGSKMIAIEQWGTNPWVSMEAAFSGADNLVNNATDTPDLSNVLSLKSMFINAASIGSSSETANWDWDTSTVQSMENMFTGALVFDQDISSWNVENVINFENMFNEATLSTPNYESLLISWAAQNINNLLTFDGGLSQYCSQSARTARNSLIFTDSLSISDGGLCEEGYFITTWKTDNPGTSNSTSITIPTEDSEVYSYQVDWNGDGDFDDTDENINYSGNATHDYGIAGTYTVKIKGIFPRIFFNFIGDREKILSIEQWGTKTWSSMSQSFNGALNLQMNAQDTPDLSQVNNMSVMFAQANNNMQFSTGNWQWDTSNITNMSSLFITSKFNFDISSWNVQNVVNFNFILNNNAAFSTENYDKILSTWRNQNLQSDIDFGTNLTQYCSQAAQDGRASIIANYNWNFDDAGLDPDCDTSVPENHFVITVDTENTGSSGPASFSIPTIGNGYNYSIDANNDGVFEFTGITGPWTINYASVGIKTIRIAGDFPRIYFNESGDKDKILSVEQWGTTRWTSMNNAFSGASNFVVNATDTPNLSDVSSLFRMFKDATNIGNGTGNWNWDTSNITGMAQTFQNAINFDKDISSWNIENVTNVGGMFTGATLSDFNYEALLISWDAQNVNPSLAFNGGNSQYCSQTAITARANLENNDLWSISDGGLCNNTAPIFTSPNEVNSPENQTFIMNIVALDNESDAVTYSKTGGADEALFTLNASTGELSFLSAPDFENPGSSLSTNTYIIEITATDDGVPIESSTQSLMITVTDVTEEDPSTFFTTTWKTDNPSTSNDTSITIPTTPFLSDEYAYFVDWNGDGDFEDTGEDIRHTQEATFDYGIVGTYTINIKGDFPRIYFANATDRQKLIAINQWGTSQWSSMNQAFSGATNVVNNAQDTPDLSNVDTLSQMFLDADMIGSENDTGNWEWDTSTINDLTNTFKGANLFNKNLNTWNTASVTKMEGTFDGAISFNHNLDNWVTSNVQRLDSMFHNARAFDQDISGWNIENVVSFTRFLGGATLSTPNYEALLVNWSSQTVSQNEIFDGGNSQFCTQASIQGRQNLENTYNWNITDGEIDQSCTDAIDVSVNISDNTKSFLPGDIIDYVVTITNTSSFEAIDTRLRFYDDYDLIEFISWDCDQVNDPTCNPSPTPLEYEEGINLFINISANDSITYTFTVQVLDEMLNDNLEIFADISLSDYQYDNNQDNNEAMDTNINQDFVYENGFETIQERIINTDAKQIEYDFSKLDLTKLGINPKAIVKGLNSNKQTNLWIHLRYHNNQLQIRLSTKQDRTWFVGKWQEVINTELIKLHWD